ncbi:hypothetical protein [Ensifer adhaerens]|uniref:hypothetical protein n=1 Tax=Ensifer adhaerens TaxID=106592 RepID=UPI003F86CAE6
MKRDNRWNLSETDKDLYRVFAAAKKESPQFVIDHDGVFTVSFTRHGIKGSGQEYLTGGGPDEE